MKRKESIKSVRSVKSVKRGVGAHGYASSEPRILSSEEKRELILAHAEARHPIDPMQRMTVAIGVAVCVLVVAGAWLYTVGSGIQKSLAGPMDADLKGTIDSIKKAGTDTGIETESVSEQAQGVINQLKEYAERQAVIDRMTEQLSATSTSSSRSDLFQPPTTSSHPLK